MRKLGTVLAVILTALGLMLVAPAAAEATATACQTELCLKVSGSGLHVDGVQMSLNVSSGTTWRGHFNIYVSAEDQPYNGYGNFDRSTHSYTWKGPFIKWTQRRFYTGSWTVDNQRIYIYSGPSNRAKVCASSVGNTYNHTVCVSVHK